ncbi:MAG: hypothetical protein RCG15_02550 [Candidatus Rickettsia vulgarisii]
MIDEVEIYLKTNKQEKTQERSKKLVSIIGNNLSKEAFNKLKNPIGKENEKITPSEKEKKLEAISSISSKSNGDEKKRQSERKGRYEGEKFFNRLGGSIEDIILVEDGKKLIRNNHSYNDILQVIKIPNLQGKPNNRFNLENEGEIINPDGSRRNSFNEESFKQEVDDLLVQQEVEDDRAVIIQKHFKGYKFRKDNPRINNQNQNDNNPIVDFGEGIEGIFEPEIRARRAQREEINNEVRVNSS